jgi:hypothetical protein
MITIKDIAENLEQTLNGKEYENIEAYGLNDVIPATSFRFNIALDTDKYKEPERDINSVVRYINAVMTVMGDSKEGRDNETYNAVVQTRVEFVVPACGDDGKLLLERVRGLLDNVLTGSEHEYITDGTYTYLQTIEYAFANTGVREQRDKVGDSLTLSMYIDYSYATEGVASDAIIVECSLKKEGSYTPVRFSRFGMARKTVYDPNVPSGNGNPITKNVPTSTALTISMDLVARLYDFDTMIRKYTLKGELSPIFVKVSLPNGYDKNTGSILYDTETYEMVLETSGVNGELGKLASNSVTLIEKM